MDNRLPIDRVTQAFEARGITVRFKPSGQGRAKCPAHPDQRPSLSIKKTERGDVVMKCHTGCRLNAILAALGLRQQDLFIGPRLPRTRASIVAIYDYHDRDGTLPARKMRSAPKAFWWQHADPAARDGWRSGLGGMGLPGLYRWPELIGAPFVVLVEGEKAVDRLRRLGLTATCGSAGASVWKSSWSTDLLEAVAPGAAIVILPDNDAAGRRQVERQAPDLRRCESRVNLRVVNLPGLPPAGDVADWLEAGHTLDELHELVASTPLWSPGDFERRRHQRRAAQAKERMRKHRARQRGVDSQVGALMGGTNDPFAKAFDAVRAVLEAAEPRSGRGVKTAITSAMGASAPSRAAIERALAQLRQVRPADEGDRRGHKWLYCLADLHRVTESGHPTHLHSVTPPGQLATGVPPPTAATPPALSELSKQIPVSGCPVTPCAVTPVNASLTLQEVVWKDRLTSVTGRGTPAIPSSVTVGGTEETARVAIVDEERTMPPTVTAHGSTIWVPTAQRLAIEAGRCCGNGDGDPQCKTCRWSAEAEAVGRW